MRKKLLPVAALILAALAGGVLYRGSASPQATPAPPSTTLLLTFGLKATKSESWEGKATVSGGAIASTEGRHFSAGDEISGPGAWKCATRRDDVAPYADIHYTEMRPGSKPDVLFQPVGVFLTIHPAAATRVSIETAPGILRFCARRYQGDTHTRTRRSRDGGARRKR